MEIEDKFTLQLQGYVLEFDWHLYTVTFYSAYSERSEGPLVSVNIEFLKEAIQEGEIFFEGYKKYD